MDESGRIRLPIPLKMQDCKGAILTEPSSVSK